MDYIQGTGLADMQMLSKFNKRFRFSLCAFDIYSKCTWVILLKDKKRITFTDALRKILNEQKRKPIKYG